MDKNFHPRENGWLGFIAEIDGVRIYHAGDTDIIPEMKDFKVDIALLPVSGTYVMDAEQAAISALTIRPPCTMGALWAVIRMRLISKRLWKARLRCSYFGKLNNHDSSIPCTVQ